VNVCVFYRLGNIGVFYGNHEVPWNHRFPFSIIDHPQYVGALLTIWGFFLVARFPRDDWLFLPVLEPAYYFAGAYFER
jgi:phosphatidyl-N-methylethanolamine N-methyltransferase